jgi:L-lactate dehydrogenase complex protein LldG
LLRLFAERLEDYKATVHRCTTADLPTTLAEVTLGWRVVVPAGSAISVPGALRDDPPLSHAELDRVDAALTGCAAACAETGTIALDAGADQGRRALTLIPDRHVCVVRADQVVHSVPELVRRLDPGRPLTFVSGPSATSDIELDRVEGVHGPRTLIVLLVDVPTDD